MGFTLQCRSTRMDRTLQCTLQCSPRGWAVHYSVLYSVSPRGWVHSVQPSSVQSGSYLGPRQSPHALYAVSRKFPQRCFETRWLYALQSFQGRESSQRFLLSISPAGVRQCHVESLMLLNTLEEVGMGLLKKARKIWTPKSRLADASPTHRASRAPLGRQIIHF